MQWEILAKSGIPEEKIPQFRCVRPCTAPADISCGTSAAVHQLRYNSCSTSPESALIVFGVEGGRGEGTGAAGGDAR
jgi:hypothetical protein